ncbi:MBL fold metallo-hydrolase [Zavarzinia sp.]|uniref:MBL fold metallo-hydrolase n=1 Tax=Zavarzinia sp. TaxID=2027920 RepID=UPI0035618B2C
MLKVGIVPVTPFAQNCSLVWCDETMKGAAIDPGGDLDRIRAAIQKVGITLEKVLLTHGHLDHASAAGELATEAGVKIEGPHRDDQFLIDSLQTQGKAYGFPVHPAFTPDRWLEGGDTVTVGKEVLEVRHCPGHTPGHVIFFHAPSKLAIVGDVLFQGSIGRTDFPRGDHATLVRSITEQLWPLGADVTFVPGHGPHSTFGAERRSNPFVGDRVLAAGA